MRVIFGLVETIEFLYQLINAERNVALGFKRRFLEFSPINADFVCWAVTIAFCSLKISASFSGVETAF